MISWLIMNKANKLLWHRSAAKGTKMMGLAAVVGAGILGGLLAPFILLHLLEIYQLVIPGIWLLTGISLFGFSLYHRKKANGGSYE